MHRLKLAGMSTGESVFKCNTFPIIQYLTILLHQFPSNRNLSAVIDLQPLWISSLAVWVDIIQYSSFYVIHHQAVTGIWLAHC
ncbi:hypothetical protein [Spirosoma flavus]